VRPRIHIVAMSRRSFGGRPFTVSGGPFAAPQTMGWHLTDERGHTLGVACDDDLVERIEALEDLVELLVRCDAAYHLRERRAQGYLGGLSDEDAARLRDLFEMLGPRKGTASPK